jgi:L-amino acid N-acyltransferase YncA
MQIRKARPDDRQELAELFTEIVRAGGTTAIETELTPDEFDHWFISGPAILVSHVAEVEGRLMGFQILSTYGDVPEGWGDIGTFARVSSTQKGVGTALFAATQQAARALGLKTLNATIRADNSGGLAYYSRMGFEDYDRVVGVTLKDGTPVDRVKKMWVVG